MFRKSRRTHTRWPLLLALLACVLFQNFWMWADDRLIGGLPVNLAYHLALCIAAAAGMAAVVRWAWPGDLNG